MKRLLFFNLMLIGFILVLAQLGVKTRLDIFSTSQWIEPEEIPELPHNYTLDKSLCILMWKEYIPTDIFTHFTKNYGTTFDLVSYESNEQMLELFHAEPERFDILFPSEHVIPYLVKNKYIARLDHSNIPLMHDLQEEVLSEEFDKGLVYSIPITKYCLGIIFDIDYISGIPRNWDFIFEQEKNPYLTGRIALLDEMHPTLGITLALLGFSPNSSDPKEINMARDLLIDRRKNYGISFLPDDMTEAFMAKDILLALTWNGGASHTMSLDPDIRFLIPEGPTITLYDCLVINANSKKKQTAEFFMNYLLVPEITARLTNYCHYANTNTESLAFVDRSIRNGPSYIFPDEKDQLLLAGINESYTYYQAAWQQIKDATIDDTSRLPLPENGLFGGDDEEEEDRYKWHSTRKAKQTPTPVSNNN